MKVNYFTIFFSHSESCLFTLLLLSFSVQKLSSLIRSHLFTFAFISITLGGGVIENLNLCHWVFCLRFPLRVLSFLVLHLGLWFILSLSLCMELGSVLISFFYTCICSVFPAPFIEEAVFAWLYILFSFVKNKVPMSVWVFFWAFYLVPLVYISVFVPVPYCLDDCSFEV